MKRVTVLLVIFVLLYASESWPATRGYTGNFMDKGLSGENVLAFGAAGDGITDDRAAINTAHTAATVAGNDLIFPPGTYKISSNITFDSDVTLVFQPGATLAIDTAVTVTINGKIAPTLHQIFALTGTGVAVPAAGSIIEVYPQWWGATGDGMTDDTAAIQAAIDAATASDGTVFFTSGMYMASTLVSVSAKINLRGIGWQSEIRRLADETEPLIDFRDFSEGQISQLKITEDLAYNNTGPLIKIWLTDDFAIKDVWLSGGYDLLHLDRVSNAFVHDSIIENSRRYAIYLEQGILSRIESNTFFNNNLDAGTPAATIKVYNIEGYSYGAYDNIITDNYFNRCSAGHFIETDGAAGLVISNNFFSMAGEFNNNAKDDIYLAGSEYVTITGNTSSLQFNTYLERISDVSHTEDSSADFSTTGGDAIREWIARKFTMTVTDAAFIVRVKLGRTGTPAGMVYATIYTENGGLPNVQTGGDSDAVPTANITSSASGDYVRFLWSSDRPSLSASTDYFIVLKTVGYTYTDTTTELRWAHAATGGSSEFYQYDADAGPAWTLMDADYGVNFVLWRDGARASRYCVNIASDNRDIVVGPNAFQPGISGTINDDSGEAQILAGNDVDVLKAKLNLRRNIITRTSAYALADTDDIILGDATAGSFTLTLPFISNATPHADVGQTFTIKKIDASANYVHVNSRSGETIDGNSPSPSMYVIGQYNFITVVNDGTEWHVVARGYEAIRAIADGDTTPNARLADAMKTANTNPTTITTFDNASAGQSIVVIFGDALTTIDFTGTNLKGNGGVDWSPVAEDHMTCEFDGTNWYCDIAAGNLVATNTYNFAADSEGSDAYVITLDPAPAAYVTGMMITFTANTANTGACTVNVNGLGAKPLKMLHDQDPGDNYIEAGSVVMAIYDGTNFQMIQPAAN